MRSVDVFRWGIIYMTTSAHVKQPVVHPRSENMVVWAIKSTSANGMQAGCKKKCGSLSRVSASSSQAAAKSTDQFIFMSIHSASDKLGHIKQAECGICPVHP